jgi:hypothetical protein
MRASRVLRQVVAALAVLAATSTMPAVGAVQTSPPAVVAPPAVSTIAAAPDPVWSTPVTAVPDRGQPSDVSCPTTTWCMAVDLSGRVLTFNGTTWSTPKVVFPRVDGQNPGVRAVSCPTTSFCMAVSDYGYGIYRSGTWTVTRSAIAPFRAVDCYSAARCGLVRGDGSSGRGLTTWNGSTLSAPVTAPWASRVDAIACPSATVCHAIGIEPKGGAIALRTSGSGWVASYLGSAWPHTTLDLSCTSASFCLATSGSAYRTWRWNGSAWANAANADDGRLFDIESVSCTSSSSCTAVGDGRTGRWNGSTWSVRDLYPIYGASYSMDCATSSSCLVVDDRGRWWRGGGSTWTAAKSFDPTSQWVADLSCPTATFCMATDYVGNAVRWNGSGWTGMSRLGTRPSSVSCLSPTWCMTVDAQQGTYRKWTGAWGPATTFDRIGPYWPVECASTTACFTFQYGEVRRWNGTTWSSPTRLFTSFERVEIECRGSRFCIAMTYDGQFSTWNGTSWSARRASGVTEARRLTCTSSAFCMVISASDLYSTFNGSTWSVRRVLPYAVGALGCMSSTRCLAADYQGVVWVWSGGPWLAAPNRLAFQAITMACVTTRCMAMGYEKASWTL